MSGKDKIAPIRLTVLPAKMIFLLTLCLGGLSAHFLADNIEHFPWQPVAETFSFQADHGDHQEITTLVIKLVPARPIASVQCAPLQDNLFRLFPPLSPLLNPPKFA
jgi:hypothetical protein